VGSVSELAGVVARFARALRSGDELLVAYNAPSSLDVPAPDGVVLLWDGPRGSPGAARNAAARWLAHRFPGAMPKWNLLALSRDSAAQLRRGDLALQAAVVSGWWAFELGRRAPDWMAR
jgi:hypothetical protein